MKHISEELSKFMEKLSRNSAENKYYNIKNFLNAVLIDLRDIGKELGFTDEEIMNDIREEVLEIIGEYVD